MKLHRLIAASIVGISLLAPSTSAFACDHDGHSSWSLFGFCNHTDHDRDNDRDKDKDKDKDRDHDRDGHDCDHGGSSTGGHSTGGGSSSGGGSSTGGGSSSGGGVTVGPKG